MPLSTEIELLNDHPSIRGTAPERCDECLEWFQRHELTNTMNDGLLCPDCLDNAKARAAAEDMEEEEGGDE